MEFSKVRELIKNIFNRNIYNSYESFEYIKSIKKTSFKTEVF